MPATSQKSFSLKESQQNKLIIEHSSQKSNLGKELTELTRLIPQES
jgi:hypothetical protein